LLKIVNNTHYKKLLKELKMLSEKLSMIHEKENLEIMREKVFALGSLKEQKEFVDNLYEGQESKNKVMQSYLANYDIEPSNFHWNVAFLDGTHFRDKIDLFVGGSPCQSFSLVGKQRGLDDTRGTLFYEYARLVGEIQPKVFIYENVRAVLSNDNGETWKTMSKIFDDLGYDWSYQVLNAKDYGVPQNRERVFVVGFRKDLGITNFKFPDPIELTSSMKDYLLDNVSGKYYLPKKGVEFVTSEKNLDKRYTQIDGDIQLCQKKNQQFNWHGDFVFVEENTNQEKLMEDLEKYFLSEKVKKYVLSTGTKGFYSKPEIDLDIARPLLQSMHKMHRAGIDNYVTTEGRLRKLTPRECLRLMGFCDSFKIVVSDTSAYQQSGNSIVVDVLMKICEEIFNKLKF
ncbi:DNA cytosine methyltransferase, partial [Streptococcus suis]|uniref:DNA cytosine methyltransferase n=2 Tax=Streptococcus TaxID=1301 RepID=UPI003BF86F44